jgi:hypothetical protein
MWIETDLKRRLNGLETQIKRIERITQIRKRRLNGLNGLRRVECGGWDVLSAGIREFPLRTDVCWILGFVELTVWVGTILVGNWFWD